MNEQPLHTPLHGGDIHSASLRFGIAIDDWLDISTGINPDYYPLPVIPDCYYRHLPANEDAGLIAAARQYYDCHHLVAAAGSQRLIELLPTLRSHCRVAIPDVGYQEHGLQWLRCGHTLSYYDGWQPESLTEQIDAGVVDVVVVINPCNPTAALITVELLEQWRVLLAERGGWLIVDEAFADTNPQQSFASSSHLPGVIVLRSFGKFFGLAGLRVGFALAEQRVTQLLSEQLGPWNVAGPSMYIAAQAVADTAWQQQARQQIQRSSQYLVNLVQEQLKNRVSRIVSSGLFVTVLGDAAMMIDVYNGLARQGVLVRLWQPPNDKYHALLRFGLIAEDDTKGRLHLEQALRAVGEGVV
ncbi:MAG: aminotransferase class I/II-fold pyridoxal phosphate-dependent enzyme [Spongiibacteraceae bacterium]